MVSNIEMLLDYCLRFYTRQFVMRDEMNRDTLTRFERQLDEYIYSGMASREGLPNVKYFADKACLSPHYFSDLVKRETGKTPQELIQMRLITLSKERLLDGISNINQIADALGFQYPQHFIRFFKREVGCTPGEYRKNVT